MRKTIVFDAVNKPTEIEKKEVVEFLYHQLENYGDPRNDIKKAIDYSIKEFASFGGFTMLLKENEQILAAVVINKTGMSGYIPENILVYIATHSSTRGKGVGKELMQKAITRAKGDIALHVEPNNPAIHLYKKLGFANPYLEMRLKR
ncbi:GNAT family N-acetyltransferase [Crocinitomix algicola]|uniref:GNAT family N-acetyltransferase n=1 Tax=Crocinitomix algicola TaxID=1740263 RepID=UPI000872EF9E|nr:GNAT family N-acetyltransferase [Crocinitomix algicola]